jgi:hypothetical protein
MDVVVTLSERQWESWVVEGRLPREESSSQESYFWFGDNLPRYAPIRYLPIRVPIGDVFPDADVRVYFVAHGKLRAYAPLYCIDEDNHRYAFVCRGEAVPVTIDQEIRGFGEWCYRWWKRADEKPFPEWRTP